MERRPVTGRGVQKNKRRMKAFIWIAGLAILVIGLLYFEQTAILYLLATLGLTGLLVIVALSDLDGSRGVRASELGDDAAAIGDGLTGTPAVASPAPAARRRSAAKRR